MQMSDFEMLSLVFIVLGIIINILLEYIRNTKNNRPSHGYGYF